MKRRLITGKYVVARCKCTEGELSGLVTPTISSTVVSGETLCPTCKFFYWATGKDADKVMEARKLKREGDFLMLFKIIAFIAIYFLALLLSSPNTTEVVFAGFLTIVITLIIFLSAA